MDVFIKPVVIFSKWAVKADAPTNNKIVNIVANKSFVLIVRFLNIRAHLLSQLISQSTCLSEYKEEITIIIIANPETNQDKLTQPCCSSKVIFMTTDITQPNTKIVLENDQLPPK